MEEQLISLETARLAKEKGFDWEINAAFVDLSDFKESISLTEFVHKSNHNKKGHRYSCPSQSLLQKWLREKGIIVYVKPNDIDDASKFFEWKVFILNKDLNRFPERHGSEHLPFARRFDNSTWEEALEKGLQEGLKLIEK